MATVKLGWRKLSAEDGSAIRRCEVEARNGGAARDEAQGKQRKHRYRLLLVRGQPAQHNAL